MSHSVLITSSVISPALFFLNIALAMCGHLLVHTILRLFIPMKNAIGIVVRIGLNIQIDFVWQIL
jgi:hypothetical protein